MHEQAHGRNRSLGVVHEADQLAKRCPSAQIDGAAEAARTLGADIIVVLGGGSAMDVAKMAAGVAPDDKPAEDYVLLSDPFAGPVLPVIAIPTTAGTGAEMTQMQQRLKTPDPGYKGNCTDWRIY